uniref:FISNA domain-containing protein n=1 Tax=Neogobius melanostomus TaxID=47308 RepID=A0A8C6T7L5_9GOBI
MLIFAGPKEALAEYKESLKTKCGRVCEGSDSGTRALLEQVFTELYITEGFSQDSRVQHEVSQMEADSKKKNIQEMVIRCSNIFKPLPTGHPQGAPLRVVLTVGVAGAGKTFAVLKFCLDWAQGSENQELQLVVPLSFREMNLLTTREHYSLMDHSKVLIICDGLDESRLPLDFSCEVVSEVTQRSEVSALLVNLIRGDLLPHAQIWITSRPAAAGQIPARRVHRVTEVRGFFTDDQKEQFFRKKFTDEEMVNTVLSHLRTSRSLYNMCQIPVFSWVTATVLEHVLRTCQSEPLPQTLTELYTNFLLVQTHRKRKYGAESSSSELSTADCELLLKLGRLAFEQLQKGNIMFYQEDLEQVGLDLSEHQHFHCLVEMNDQSVQQQIQDFLNSGDQSQPLSEIQCSALAYMLQMSEQVLEELNLNKYNTTREGRWRLIPVVRNCRKALTSTSVTTRRHREHASKSVKSPLHNPVMCILEINHIVSKLTYILSSAFRIKDCMLTWHSCHSLASALWFNPSHLKELDLSDNFLRDSGVEELSVLLQSHTSTCRSSGQLSCCSFSALSCSSLANALQSNPSHLQELELSYNELQDTAVETLCQFLQAPLCALQILGSAAVTVTFSSSICSSNNVFTDVLHILCAFLQTPGCELQTLRSVSEVYCWFYHVLSKMFGLILFCLCHVSLDESGPLL